MGPQEGPSRGAGLGQVLEPQQELVEVQELGAGLGQVLE